MFLTDFQIRKIIERKELIIEPPLEKHSYGFCSIDLRLGTEFSQDIKKPISRETAYDPVKQSVSNKDVVNQNIISINFGDNIIVQPHTTILATTLEFIEIPFNLIGFIYPRSTWDRLGLRIVSSIIYPGFSGRLTIRIDNVCDIPIRLYPGLRILQILFATVERPEQPYKAKYKPSTGISPSFIFKDQEIKTIQELLKKQEDKLKAKTIEESNIRNLLNESLNAEKSKKGQIFEQLSTEIFKNIAGLEIIKVNARLKAEEIDIILQNNIDFGFWRFAGSPIIVECKNWSSKVGAREISILTDKMMSISPDVKTGFLISPKGITGNSYHDAVLKVREKRQQGKNIIVLDLNSLEKMANGKNVSKVIEEEYNRLLFI